MLRHVVFLLAVLALARAQIPSLGFCPEYVPMANFDMNRFTGVWYEAERYFQLSEVVSRCVMSNYSKGSDGKFRVSSEVTNRFTGIKRVLDGEIKTPASKAEQGKLHVKYTTIPLTPETQFSVLKTDYDNYAVLWSCSGLGPVHAQNAWLMTRERIPSGEVIQKAYGVLDKYKISRTFFVKTDQEDCAFLNTLPSKPNDPEDQLNEDYDSRKETGYRTDIVPDTPDVIINTRKAETDAQEKVELVTEVKAAPSDSKPIEKEEVKTIPELILEAAEMKKEEKAEEPKEPSKIQPAKEKLEKIKHAEKLKV